MNDNTLEENELRDDPSNNTEVGLVFTGPLSTVSTVSKSFSLYEEMAYRVKCLLFSNRKRDLVCCISMTFDMTHFDGLIRRDTLVKGSKLCIHY